MRYDVVWTIRSLDQLARLWTYLKADAVSPTVEEMTGLGRSELHAFTRSLEQIDRILGCRALLVGRGFQRSMLRRIFTLGPVEVGYDVETTARLVRVFVVAYSPRRQ